MTVGFDPYHKWLGIPPKDQPPNHYRLLALDMFESDPDVIDTAPSKQVAYLRTCATRPHVALSQNILNEIAAARLCLLDPKKKAAYDDEIRREMEAAQTSEAGIDDTSSASKAAADSSDSTRVPVFSPKSVAHGSAHKRRRSKARCCSIVKPRIGRRSSLQTRTAT